MSDIFHKSIDKYEFLQYNYLQMSKDVHSAQAEWRLFYFEKEREL